MPCRYRPCLLRQAVFGRLFARLHAESESAQLLHAKTVIEIPEPVYRYAQGISRFTGLPLKEVLQSKPVKNLIEAYERKVKVVL